ncbi:MAG: ABC transporter permease [Firmicutes bacterium]|nr:ABC transporter permease [Bacillota bacterium]
MAQVQPQTSIGRNQPAVPWRMRRVFSSKRVTLLIGAILVAIFVIAAIFAPLITPESPEHVDLYHMLAPPGGLHWFGTDELGRDLYTRIVYGARTSLTVSSIAVAIGAIIGVSLGLLTGYVGGWVDEWIIMRLMDALQAFPFLIFALVIGAVLGGGIVNAEIAIGIGFIPGFVRIARAQVLIHKRAEYVESARVVGAGPMRIMVLHILPNIMAPIIVQLSLALAGGIVAEAGLSYLGLGVQPPTPSWGAMLKSAQGYLTIAPWLAIFPGVALALAVLGFNYLGDGLSDLMNPKT